MHALPWQTAGLTLMRSCQFPTVSILARLAVVANAIYDAVGARLLQLPMKPARVLATKNG